MAHVPEPNEFVVIVSKGKKWKPIHPPLLHHIAIALLPLSAHSIEGVILMEFSFFRPYLPNRVALVPIFPSTTVGLVRGVSVDTLRIFEISTAEPQFY